MMSLQRASAAARLLNLKPSPAGEEACAFQVLEIMLARRGEVRIVRIGTATVAIAGTESAENEVGGDGPNILEAVVAAACDMVRAEEIAAKNPIIELDEEEEDQGLFSSW